MLTELLKPEYDSMWMVVLYGISGVGNGDIVEVGLSQLGQVGGEPYWRWYGFGYRVDWCAVFVSWCADQLGYIEAGVIPKFASCAVGIAWFKERGQWLPPGSVPEPGMIIFFDWKQDGIANHVGIVEKVEGGYVYTVEGNARDQCKNLRYSLQNGEIFGYGVPGY